MSRLEVDILVIGSGFAGSLTAWLLQRDGWRVTLLESGRHPRFAIGESSTPLADFKLRGLAARFDLPSLDALSRYGSWLETHPHLMRGVKRGFSYFYHREGETFQSDQSHCHELVVAASRDKAVADTHWMRADLDEWFVQQAIASGVEYLDQANITDSAPSTGTMTIRRQAETISLSSRFVVIATGNPSLWQSAIDVPQTKVVPRTKSRTLFAHFAGVMPWSEQLQQMHIMTSEHPFDCDQAALHHVFDGGWMWQLRFDDQTISAGFMLDVNRYPVDPALNVESEWQSWLQRFPSIEKQFASATIVRPESGLQRVNCLQHPFREITGERYALLPAAVGFADPLFSTGIGHALFSVEALVDALRNLNNAPECKRALRMYGQRMLRELEMIDRFVSLAYRQSSRFEHYVTATMPYFAAATTCERLARDQQATDFLLANDDAFLQSMSLIEANVCDATFVEEQLRRFNHVGLFRPRVPHMYAYTATK